MMWVDKQLKGRGNNSDVWRYYMMGFLVQGDKDKSKAAKGSALDPMVPHGTGDPPQECAQQ